MAKIHILDGNTNSQYRVVVHAATPAGNNAVGTPWATAVKNSGRAVSVLTVGPGAGQILQSEMNDILNGTIIEGSFQWDDVPGWTNQQRADDINTRASQLVTQLLERYSLELKFFGHTQG